MKVSDSPAACSSVSRVDSSSVHAATHFPRARGEVAKGLVAGIGSPRCACVVDVCQDVVALVEECVDGGWVACASCLFEVPFVLVELVLEA